MHEGALRRPEVDPALGLQSLQGFSYGLAADPKYSASSSSTRCWPGLRVWFTMSSISASYTA
ncbi:hypothetical protein [Fodinicola feengrottensis]|uniref:hypothetical protein n=1 Tax=Fodinicola feengrottensis TaxID=435914 RepID=UPI0024413C9B|nr:hypothetical protein [Fodinicola feengrottensis]